METNKKDKKAVVVAEKPIAEKYKGKPSEDVVEHVIQELEAMIVERTKTARENTIYAFWETGEILRKCERDNKVSISNLVNRLAMDNRLTGRQMGERNLWFAVKIFDKFPKFDKVYQTEHGENVSLSKIKKMLVTSKARIEKSIKQMAAEIVQRLDIEKARSLAEEIVKECDREEKKRSGQ